MGSNGRFSKEDLINAGFKQTPEGWQRSTSKERSCGTASQNKPTTSKYRNIKVEIDGYTFDSKKEGDWYGKLKMLQLGGDISDLKLQVPFEITFNGVKVCKYIADFTYTIPEEPEKGLIVLDCKGMKTATYRLKKKLMKAVLGIEITEV